MMAQRIGVGIIIVNKPTPMMMRSHIDPKYCFMRNPYLPRAGRERMRGAGTPRPPAPLPGGAFAWLLEDAEDASRCALRPSETVDHAGIHLADALGAGLGRIRAGSAGRAHGNRAERVEMQQHEVRMRRLGHAIGDALPRDTANLRGVQVMHQRLESLAFNATTNGNASGTGTVDSDRRRHDLPFIRLAGATRRGPYPHDTRRMARSSHPSQTFANFWLSDCPNSRTGPVRHLYGGGLPNRL